MNRTRVAADAAEQKTIDDVRKYGLHIISVSEDTVGPGFCFSIGLFENYAHPEVIIIGLRQSLAHVLLNNMGEDIKNGRTFTPGEFHDDVLDDFLCYFGEVPREHYRDFVGWARWFYDGDDFPLLQCVYPTVSGIFPWEKDFPEEARAWNAVMLTDPPKEH